MVMSSRAQREQPPHQPPTPQHHCCSCCPSSSATAALQRQPWNFSQALVCPQKCRFLQEFAQPGGLRSQLLPFPSTGASPAWALAASPSCSHAPNFLPRGPPSSCRFFSRLSQHQAALQRVCEGQTGWRGSAGVGRQPTAAQGSLHPSPLPNAPLFSSPPKNTGLICSPFFPSQAGHQGMRFLQRELGESQNR